MSELSDNIKNIESLIVVGRIEISLKNESTRLKNAVLKAVSTGLCNTMGKAAKIAFIICEHNKLPLLVKSNARGWTRINSHFSSTPSVQEAITATTMAARMMDAHATTLRSLKSFSTGGGMRGYGMYVEDEVANLLVKNLAGYNEFHRPRIDEVLEDIVHDRIVLHIDGK